MFDITINTKYKLKEKIMWNIKQKYIENYSNNIQ